MLGKIRAGLLAGVVAVATLSGGAVKAAEFEFRMGIISSENSIYYEDMAKPFADLVKQMTDGRVEIRIMPAGTVGSVLKLHEAVQDGLLDMAQTTPIFLGTADLVNAMVASFPTGLGMDSYLPWLYQAGGLELWQEHRKTKMGMHALVSALGPSEFFAHSKTPIRTAEDMKGKKFRTLGNWAAITRDGFGTVPTVVAGSEIYGMLEKGGIDMAEYSIPSENQKIGLHEIAKYIVYPGIQAPAWAFETVMLTETWQKLPKDIQEKMALASELNTFRSMNAMIRRDLVAMAELQAGGNEFVKLDDAFVAQAQEKSREWALNLAKEQAAKGDDLPMRLAKSVFEFQDNWRKNSKYFVVDFRAE